MFGNWLAGYRRENSQRNPMHVCALRVVGEISPYMHTYVHTTYLHANIHTHTYTRHVYHTSILPYILSRTIQSQTIHVWKLRNDLQSIDFRDDSNISAVYLICSGEVFILGFFSFFGWIFFLFLVPWSPGPLMPWCPGHLVPLHLVPSLSGPQPLVLWSPGPLVLWSSGPLVPCSSGLLVPWSSVLFRSFFSNLSFTLFYYQFYIFALSCVCSFSFFVLFLCCRSFHAFQCVDLFYFHSLYVFFVFSFGSVLLVFLFFISYVFLFFVSFIVIIVYFLSLILVHVLLLFQCSIFPFLEYYLLV